jgi:hypothetical protein
MSRPSEILTPHDEAWLAAQARQAQMVGDVIELAHLEARMGRHLKEAEAIKVRCMELHRDEATNCMETASCTIEDAKAALR